VDNNFNAFRFQHAVILCSLRDMQPFHQTLNSSIVSYRIV